MFAFTETWLQDNIPDAAIQLERMTASRVDRDAGGGLCISINKDCCVNATLAMKQCSQMTGSSSWNASHSISAKGFHHSDVAVVYIAPSKNAKANANEALGGLHDAIFELLTKHPDSFVVVTGDFNHTSLKAVFPKFKRVVDRGGNMLDLVATPCRHPTICCAGACLQATAEAQQAHEKPISKQQLFSVMYLLWNIFYLLTSAKHFWSKNKWLKTEHWAISVWLLNFGTDKHINN